MLESIRRGQRWLTGVLVALVGGVFVFFMGLGQPLQGNAPSQGIVVELGDIRFAYPDFLRVREQQATAYRDQLGDQFSSKVGQSFLDAQALRSLVDRAILAYDAHAMGLRVGKEEIQRVILQSPGFRDEAGKFDQPQFRDWVEWQYGNEANYIEFTRSALLGQKMAQLLYAQGGVSEGEAQAAALHRLQQVQIAYVAIDSETLPTGSETTEEQITSYATDHDNELRRVYQDRLEVFQLSEEMRLRHILFELGSDPTPGELKEVQAKADAALERLKGGEEFSDVAAELSEDVSTRDAGGDLGLVSPDDIASELADAARALAAGEHSEVVRSDRGLHLVLLEERVEAGTRPFEEVRDELAREGATRQAARERADRLTDELATSIREGKTLEEAAREMELEIERTGMLRRRADGFIVGLGASSDLLAMAFALTPEKPTSPEIFEVGSKLALIQLLDRTEPEPDVLTGAIAGERSRLATAKQNAFVQNWIEERRTQLTDNGQLKIDSTILEES
jgi:peptidyl-prolyl cis-trans isomerase D